MIVFEKALFDQMKKDAESRYPKECCGILLGRKTKAGERIVELVYPTANEAREGQERQFRINPMTLFQVEQYAAKSHMEIVGFYHSHPDCKAAASQEDERSALPGFSYPILSVLRGEVSDVQSWVLDKKGIKKHFQNEKIQYQEN